MDSYKSFKKYVRVQALFYPDGTLMPQKFWIDDEEYDIDKVSDCRMAASLKAGGCGWRYTIRCRGTEGHMYFEKDETDAWFLEMNEAVMSEPAYQEA